MKKRILLLSEELGQGGGGKGVAAFVLQTLAREYDVTLLCWSPPDCAAVDAWCDTRLAECRWHYEGPTPAERLLVRAIPDTTHFQRINVLQKRARRMAPSFDAAVGSCSLEIDLGIPALQYLHYPYLGHVDWRGLTPGDVPLPRLAAAVLRRRTLPWMAISRYSFERMRRNYTLTNSRWTVRRIRELFDMPAAVVYPPAAGNVFTRDWAQRRDGFVAIGRMEPNKRFDWMIQTIAAVRARGLPAELHIVTHLDPVWYEPEANRRVRELAREAGGWVHLHYDLPRHELMRLLAENRYGLHAKIDEHFGMAPAEVARAGCLPFVHDSGGQVEIIENDARLRFTTLEDAAERITAVMQSPVLQHELLDKVSRHAVLFAPEAFAAGLLHHMERFLSGHRGPDGQEEPE